MQDFEDWETSGLIGIARACLNRADLRELWRYRRDLLTPIQADLLRIVQDKIDGQPELFDRQRQGYAQMAGLVLMSDWDRAIDFCTCMDIGARHRYHLMNKKRRKLNCGQWRFCAHCAWRREMDLQCRFLRTFNQGLWSWLTASFTGNLPMLSSYLNPDHRLVSHADIDTYLGAIRFAIKTMTDEGVFRGAILNEELHLESLYPLPLVTPHSHILILSNEPIVQAHLDRFQALTHQYRGQVWDLVSTGPNDARWEDYALKLTAHAKGFTETKPRRPPMLMVPDPRLKVELPINLDLKELQTQVDFAAVLDYPIKPVEITSPYLKARNALLRENPSDLEMLAQNVDEFIVASDLILTPRRSPVYYGACDPRRRRRTPYIGAPGSLVEDVDHRDQTKELLANLHPTAKIPDAS